MVRYTHEHIWLTVAGDFATAGITPHAQDTLGDIVSVELPAVGASFDANAIVGVVESVKTASDLHMPLAGEIVAINEDLVSNPALANSDPLGSGWFFRLRIADAAGLDGLMDEAAYRAFTG